MDQLRRQTPEWVFGQNSVAADVVNDRRQRGDPLAMVPPHGIIWQTLALQGRKVRLFATKLDAATKELSQWDTHVRRYPLHRRVEMLQRPKFVLSRLSRSFRGPFVVTDPSGND